MEIFKKIKIKLKYLYLKTIKPEIIGGFLNRNGIFSQHSAISNMSHISQKGMNLYIDDEVFIGHFNYIDAHNAKITICKNVQITNYVSVLTHSSHNEIRMGKSDNLNKKAYSELLNVDDVYIGAYTYVGPHSVIMPGTNIGKGCIVSAYSYVKGDFPDYSIIRGIPAKIIGSTKDIDAKLLNEFPELTKSYYLNNEIN